MVDEQHVHQSGIGVHKDYTTCNNFVLKSNIQFDNLPKAPRKNKVFRPLTDYRLMLIVAKY